MLKKYSALQVLKVAIVFSALVYIATRVIITFLLNRIINLPNLGGTTVNHILGNKTQYLVQFFIIDILTILIVSIIISIIIKKIINEYSTTKNETSTFVCIQQQEIEKQKKSINNLTTLYNDAVEYNKLKTEFFSNMSHELKTPLSVILGAIQLINQKIDFSSSEQKNTSKHLKIIKQNCYRLVRLVNNILDITRIDSGYIKVNMVNYNIVYLVEEITQSIAPYAEQKGIDIEFDTELEEIITSLDIDKIERIILNLLSNAIKFTPTGGKIRVYMKGTDEKVFISVRDTGPGIPKNMQKVIFERFKQVNSKLTRESEGTGIGLSLVKLFVELHNGNIHLISQEGKGSEFIIELPIMLANSNISEDLSFNNNQSKIIEAINIEFSDIYSTAP